MGDIIVCGIDEAGRGPLAGPVSAACVHIPARYRRKRFWSRVNDSKMVPEARREELFPLIQSHACFGIGMASVEEIDRINILQATLLAMARAFDSMCRDFSLAPHMALIDGDRAPVLPCRALPVIKGDGLHVEIAAASILAKVIRDRLMKEYHRDHPHYLFAKHKGYGTREHILAIEKHGLSPLHRRSFTRKITA